MDRRDALKALGALAAATGMSVTPITTRDAEGVAVLVLKVNTLLSVEQAAYMRASLDAVLEGTPLEGVKVLVLDRETSIEVIKAARR